MKKSFLMLGVAAMALASCTQNEVVEYADSRTIQFDAFVGKSTRAVTELETAGLTQFNVFAYHTGDVVDYNNVAVKGSGSGTGWKAEANAYWQAGNAYEFAAYSDQNAAISSGVSFADKTLTFTSYTVGEKDLVAAQTSVTGVTAQYSTPVDLTFYHMLSQIKFTFTNSDAENYTLAISNIKITAGKIANGTFTMTAPSTPSITWDATDSNNGEYIITNIKDIANGPSRSTASESLLILPQSTTGLKVTFTARLTDAGNKVIATGNFEAPLTISEDGGAWKPGYRYNYIAELNGSDVPVNPTDPSQPGDEEDPKPTVIQFNVVEVDSWEDSNAAGSTTPSVVTPQP